MTRKQSGNTSGEKKALDCTIYERDDENNTDVTSTVGLSSLDITSTDVSWAGESSSRRSKHDVTSEDREDGMSHHETTFAETSHHSVHSSPRDVSPRRNASLPAAEPRGNLSPKRSAFLTNKTKSTTALVRNVLNSPKHSSSASGESGEPVGGLSSTPRPKPSSAKLQKKSTSSENSDRSSNNPGSSNPGSNNPKLNLTSSEKPSSQHWNSLAGRSKRLFPGLMYRDFKSESFGPLSEETNS